MYAKHAELKVGVLVVAASVALLALLYFAKGESLFQKRREVHFRLEVGALAPSGGDPIYISGVAVGKVDRTAFRTEERTWDELTDLERAAIEATSESTGQAHPAVVREVYVHVIGLVDQDQVLPTSTSAVLSESVTGLRRLTLDLGTSPEDIPEGATLENPITIYQAPGLTSLGDSVARMMKDATKVVATANDTLVNINGTITSLREQIGDERLATILENLLAATDALKGVVEKIEGEVGGAGEDISAAMADVKRLAASGARLLERLEGDVPELVEDLRGAVAKLDGILERAGPRVDSFLADIEKTGQNIVKLSEEFAGIGPDAQALIQGVGGDVETLIEVLTDTGRNLLDASEDLRSHPWKLLNEPSPDQIAFDNLRLTTQSYVRAMQKMQETARTLKEVAARGDASDPVVQELVRRTLGDFESSVAQYRILERRLVELLQQNAPRAAPAGRQPR